MVVRFARGGRCSGAPGPRASVVLFWAVLLLILASPVAPPGASQEDPSGSAGGVSTHLEVANVLPSGIQWSVSHDGLSGFYTFNVSASDNNGVEDLVGLVLAFRDANGVETRHEAKGPEHHNRTTGVWSGVVLANQRPIATPVEVQIEVEDRAGGVSVEKGQGEPLIVGGGSGASPVQPQADSRPWTHAALSSTLQPVHTSALWLQTTWFEMGIYFSLVALFLVAGWISFSFLLLGRYYTRVQTWFLRDGLIPPRMRRNR